MTQQKGYGQPQQQNWRRLCWALRILALALLLGAPVAFYFEPATDFLMWLILAAAFATPFLWSRQFGSWWGLLLLLLATMTPFFLTRWGLWPLTSLPAYFGALLWFLVGVFMLPGTILMLLWRRWASVNLILLCFALTPPVMVVFLLTQTFGSNPLAGTPQDAVETIGSMIPWLAITMGLCFAPIFFVGSLLWLVYQESASGASIPAQRP